MSYLELDSDISSKIIERYVLTPPAVFTGGGTTYSDGTYTGRQFTTSGTLVVGTAGYFKALIVDAGNNGGSPAGGTYDRGGNGGTGGNVRVVTGYLNAGNYTISILTGGGGLTGFTPTSSIFTKTFTPGVAGSGHLEVLNYGGSNYIYPQTAGGSGPTITTPPFTGVLASGGGGGGGRNIVGSGAVNKTGGLAAASGAVKNSTTIGGGGGGGYATSNFISTGTTSPGGTGGPGYFWIVSSNSSVDLSTTNNIPNYTFTSSEYPLSDLIDNYLAIAYNPNVSMYNIVSVPSISSYTDTYQYNGTSIINYFAGIGYRKHPFTISSSTTGASFYANYYNGYYTLAFMTSGATYTMTTTATLSFDVIVVAELITSSTTF